MCLFRCGGGAKVLFCALSPRSLSEGALVEPRDSPSTSSTRPSEHKVYRSPFTMVTRQDPSCTLDPALSARVAMLRRRCRRVASPARRPPRPIARTACLAPRCMGLHFDHEPSRGGWTRRPLARGEAALSLLVR